MAKIKASFRELTDAALLLKGTSIVTAMTGNPYFPAPVPPLAQVSAAFDAYATALQNMVNGGKDTTIIKNNARAAAEAELTDLALYVQIQSKGDGLVLQSTGFDIITRRTAIGILDKPVNFVAKAGEVPGSTKLTLDSVDGAMSYNFDFTAGPLTADSVWSTVSTPRAAVTLNGLVRGQEYFYRVVGVGTNPARVYSDVISNYVS